MKCVSSYKKIALLLPLTIIIIALVLQFSYPFKLVISISADVPSQPGKDVVDKPVPEKDVVSPQPRRDKPVPEKDVVPPQPRRKENTGPYKEGKEILYKPPENCKKPDLLKNYTNPCWKSMTHRGKIVCTAKVMLLGFHKCGTTDLSMWFGSHTGVIHTNKDFYKDFSLTSECPLKWIEEFEFTRAISAGTSKVIYNDCPGCALVSTVLSKNSTHIIRQSAIQYQQHTMVDNSRYIITMREPADRMISHFFYIHKIKRKDNPYISYSLKEVGNEFFHKIVTETVTSFTECLNEYGTTSCVLEELLSPIDYPNSYIVDMLTTGCYSTHLKEALKFIPKEKIYFSKLEEYSEDEIESIQKVYRFVGVSTEGLSAKSDQKKKVVNAGYKTKPVLPETVEVLQKFYKPFNQELAMLLGDDKWLWL